MREEEKKVGEEKSVAERAGVSGSQRASRSGLVSRGTGEMFPMGGAGSDVGQSP